MKYRLTLIIDIPSTQGGTTTTGNVVRRCLTNDKEKDFLYWVLTLIPCEYKETITEIQTRLGAILRVYNCSRQVLQNSLLWYASSSIK